MGLIALRLTLLERGQYDGKDQVAGGTSQDR